MSSDKKLPSIRRPIHNSSTSSLRELNHTRDYGSIYPISSPTVQQSNATKHKKSGHKHSSKRSRKYKRLIDNNDSKSSKLGTLNGVTLPTILNVLSILMFLRFGFIVGQMGILGTLLLLVLSYGIDLLTTLSISAIATNGTVKGGGAYYMISRSLGVEFGGAIGVIFFIGQVLNSALNVAGLIEPLLYNFNEVDGAIYKLLPVDYWFQFAYCSIFLAICIGVALIGSSAVSQAGTYLCIMLLLSTMSVPLSALFVKPFYISEYKLQYTGITWENIKDNLWPHFTKGAAGSQLNAVETFNDLFGIFFPATAGILAGASMSGDLKNPSKSIPKGTLDGLLITFSSYLFVIISMGAAIPRELLYKDVQVLQTINLSPFIILLGELSTSIFSIIVGIVGAAKLLQAIARDEILPGLSTFGNGNPITDDPKEAILFTWLLCQLFLFADINQIATFITMAFLMTFIVTNLACALLKLGSAPNFRPSFKYFSTHTALAGTVISGAAMFIVDGISASLIFVTLLFLILVIHFVSPPKQWGDVSQSLIYHQVRKYLLKLRQDNVKYWRPQVLLLVDNPRTGWKLISFCNHLKKGGLYVLGHVFVSNSFQDKAEELSRARQAWIKIRDICAVKAFVQISIAPSFSWGVRNVFLGSGLGGMKPNITILGFYDLSKYSNYRFPQGLKFESLKKNYSKQVTINMEELPTDQTIIFEPKLKITEWVQTLEDLSLLNSNIAVAKGFPRLNLPNDEESLDNEEKKYIDLYPIQMASKMESGFEDGKKILTTNFDTYTLILQLGAILNTVPAWKKTHKLRVVVFVEEEENVEEEKTRVKSLLEILRIKAEIVVKCLSVGFETYNYICKGENIKNEHFKSKIEELLKNDEWWKICQDHRKISKKLELERKSIPISRPNTENGNASNLNSRAVNKLSKSTKRRYTVSNMNRLGVSLSIVANKISANDIKRVMTDSVDDYDISSSTSDVDSVLSTTSTNSMNNNMVSSAPSGYANNTGSCGNINNYGINSNNSGCIRQISEGKKRRPVLESMKSTSSMLRVKKSTFSADTMPNSQIMENAQGNEPSIMFVDDDGEDGNGNGNRNGNSNSNSNSRSKNLDGSDKDRGRKNEPDNDNRDKDDKFYFEKSKYAEKMGKEIGEEEPGKKKAVRSELLYPKDSNEDAVADCDENDTEEDTETTEEGSIKGEEVIVSVQFGELPSRCQFIILNDLMRQVSVGETDLIFTTLPVPDIGMHKKESECVEYVVNLEIWSEDIPAMLMLNAKTMTVTTNL